MHIYGLTYIGYYIGYMYSLIYMYVLIHICYHIFFIYVVSNVLPIFTRTSDLPIFQSSDIPYYVTPYGSNAVYLSLYGLLWTCTTYTASQFQVYLQHKLP